MSKDSIHVVMVPWLAFGHVLPFFQLSIGLAKEGVHVSFISTPRNIKRLPKVPPNLAPSVNLVEFPLPALDSNLLPEDAEATLDIPSDKVQYLMVAYDLLKQPIKHFITREKPDWIIVDFSPYWVAEIARDLDIPILQFSVFTAATLQFFGQLDSGHEVQKKESKPLHELLLSPPQCGDFQSTVAYKKYEVAELFAAIAAENASGKSSMEREAIVGNASRAMALRTCAEFESEYLVQPRNYKKPLIPVGLLLPEELPVDERTLACQPNWKKISKWLDEQKPRSVVFVGFGSECKFSKNQVHEIAKGIQLSGLPFMLILQKPRWALNDIDALPSGFIAATEGRGLVHIGWAPQKEILAHPSIGGSLFHAGWGSAIETLQHGHVLVVLPFVFDQGLNARLLVEKGVAIEVKRNEEDGSFSGNDIAMSLREAMVLKEGEELRARARKVAAIFGDRKLHDSYVKNVVEYLKSNGEMKV
ncbi:putative UDP-rhamnose:rhamnosyltransferase 1 [Lycium ferocissimum]|uniref:putative UDP-rhamnose:rhamnosyltransferase 1 n=1 Tax=Lycium ferocissimum TaxID=112874 RepID=UPI002815D87C|nr:putative UDP-rhamnose:rhamnosyltransferase 1 [Lycium ferocissimum]